MNAFSFHVRNCVMGTTPVNTNCPHVTFWLYKKVDEIASSVELNKNCSVGYGQQPEKNCLRDVANNTGADQPAHPCSLISGFVIRISKSTICKLATGEISIF